MDPKKWDSPVTFEENSRGGFRTIASTEEAARVLLMDWPVRGTKAHQRAKEVMMFVLMGERPPEEARSAFLAAAADANVFIRNA
ncbi:hypothetical protein ASG39_22340 [Rhizobium sp. Leaf371]|uniref:DUF982 domain-containing protein n=1 Tax=Rhizobium sp. Leaf371 TaxID=1736355 RepID=UPI0007136340|nr:DUF982 domain-containing protein [Rhizobium sp. Leaf371]KQS69444.1 hypothetical protein ASG39_22340 [Rhizobium sp. Leaf371]